MGQQDWSDEEIKKEEVKQEETKVGQNVEQNVQVETKQKEGE